MAEITIARITDATTADDGTGIFDKLLGSVNLHINEEYEKGRITGGDYSTVYLGALQSVLAESIKFALGEQEADQRAELLREQVESENKNNEPGGVIDLTKQKIQEEVDLVIAQTANAYEDIDASRQNTQRENRLNDQNVMKTHREALLAESKTRDQNYVTDNIRPEEVDLLQSKDAEQIAHTIRTDAESAQRILLMDAQTKGFITDAKNKLLRQMADGRAAAISIAGDAGIIPNANLNTAIDNVVNDILDDLQSTVNV